MARLMGEVDVARFMFSVALLYEAKRRPPARERRWLGGVRPPLMGHPCDGALPCCVGLQHDARDRRDVDLAQSTPQ